MGTTGASGPRPWRPLALLIGVVVSCTTGPVTTGGPGAPTPSTTEPEVRIGLDVGAGSVGVGGTGLTVVRDTNGSTIATIPRGETWQVTIAGHRLGLAAQRGGGGGAISVQANAMTLTPVERNQAVRVNGKLYRGVVEIFRDRTGLTVVNRVGMESYLLGVVSAEMGRRSSAEQAALRAQAIVSRTYATRNLRRWRQQGFDLYGSVVDQVYGGVAAETPEGREAVAATRGRVLTYQGSPIEALYYSTCGGRTADGFEVFKGAARPYLRSVPDQAPTGVAYCSISPRYRWHEEWTGEGLRGTLERNLPQLTGTGARLGMVSDVRVSRRTSSGRVDQLTIVADGSEMKIDGTAVRRVLRPATGDLLKSSAFVLGVTASKAGVTRLTADGMGAGHGVGFCQWGAVGRSRAGQSLGQILAAYYPGTTVERRY